VEPQDDPLLSSFVIGVWLLSIAVWSFLIGRWKRGPLLAYEPRRPVPWGAGATILAFVFVLMAMLTATSGGGSGDAAEPTSSSEVVMRLVAAIVPQTLIVGVFCFVVAALSRATPRDLGLPRTGNQFVGDIAIGVIASLAAIAPVDTILALLKLMFHQQNEVSQHELVKMLTENKPSATILVLASIVAVVVAPVCEELTFRLMLQGWLEKWEDRRVRRDDVAQIAADIPLGENDECRMTNVELGYPQDTSLAVEPPPTNGDTSVCEEPPTHGVAGFPYGWLPILISSLLFAGAHFGYGPEPVPLFFLAIILGYMYQRTHRILPCIVTHALFNAFTMVLLWRLAFHVGK